MRPSVIITVGVLGWTSLTQCASDLERTRNERRGLPIEKVDLSLVVFEDVYTSEPVNAADHMQQNDLDFMLLMFGSVNCTKCNEKAQLLSQNYLGKHDLFLTAEEQNFSLVGVNTDSGGSRKQFESIMLNPERRTASGYDFVRWADREGDTMRTYLLGDNTFGVPFTVMLSREGIVWRFTNKQPYSMAELIAAIQATLDGREAPTPSQGGPDDDKPDGGGVTPPTEFPLLAFAHAGRLTQLSMQGCGKEVTALGDRLQASDLTFIQIDRGSCAPGSVCARNQTAMAGRVAQACSEARSCSFLTLSLKTPHRSTCSRGEAGQGGREFYDVFSSHFNWRYDPNVDEWEVPSAIPEVEGPITLGFARDGKLIYSGEGLLPPAGDPGSMERVIAGDFQPSVEGINYPVYGARNFGAAPADTDLATVRQQAKYTVVGAFDRYCIGCLEELEHWSADDQIGGYCRSRPGYCQVFGLEAELARPNSSRGRADFYVDIKTNYLDDREVTVPLLIDVDEFGDGYSRLFYSYFSPQFANWEGLYGTVIYDREGKIMANFKGGAVHDPDPILATLRKLAEYP